MYVDCFEQEVRRGKAGGGDGAGAGRQKKAEEKKKKKEEGMEEKLLGGQAMGYGSVRASVGSGG